MSADEFFELHGSLKLLPLCPGDSPVTIEDLFQAFRERMLSEIAEAVEVTVEAKAVEGIREIMSDALAKGVKNV